MEYPQIDTATHGRRAGRVLRSATSGFVFGCRVAQLSEPAFGSLVKAQPVDQREAIYGLIYNMNVDDDPLVRRLVLNEDPPDAIINDQRQNRLLPIEISVLSIGYRLNGRLLHGLPPRPPLNLDPVILVEDPEEVRAFTERLGYMRLILRTMFSDVPVDQLLIAHIQQATRLRGDDAAWALQAINEVIELLRGNYDALVPVLEALGEAMPELQLSATVPAPLTVEALFNE